MRYRTITENVAFDNWSSVITESTGVSSPEKLKWMSTFLQLNENMIVNEAAGNINESYGLQGPEAVPGMGAVRWPGVGQANGDIVTPGYQKGSGDMPSRQLAIAMNVAAYTIGLELLPVIPMEFPSMMFGYLDGVYSANFDMTQEEQGETDIFIELSGAAAGYATGAYKSLKKGDKVFLGQVPTNLTATMVGVNLPKALYGIFLGTHRINGNAIIKFEGAVQLTGVGATGASRSYTLGAATDISPATLLKVDAAAGFAWALIKGAAGGSSEEILSATDTLTITDQFVSATASAVTGDLVSAVDMHIPEFSKPGATYDGNENYAATRAAGEKGTQNIVSLRTFSTSVEAQTVEVLGEITRTQLKDLNVYGQDGISNLYRFAQNELTQTMNRDVLRTSFRLGVTAASKLKNAQGLDLNLYIGDPALNGNKSLSAFGIKEFVDITGVNRITEFPAVKNAETNSSAENNATRARRILTRILAASNMISTVGRHGAGNQVVINTQLATAIQDVKGFQPNPFENTVTLDKKNLYMIGTVQGGIRVYVDPLMDWNDTRVCVSNHGDEQTPGLKLFIYTLGESVETISEKSMAPKILISSRYSIVPVGFFPEAQYLTFAVSNDHGIV
jgi:hypothetical protein